MTSVEEEEIQMAMIQMEVDAVPPLTPTVETLQDGCDLMIEFSNNASILPKVLSLWGSSETKYTGVRYARRDGNCFYRSVVFGIFEVLLNRKEWAAAFVERVVDVSKKLIVDYGDFVEDFCQPAVEMAKSVESGECATVEQLYELSTTGNSEYILYFYRYAVSYHVRLHKDDFLPFVMGLGYGTVEEFCAAEVDAVASEADNMQVVAFAQCFGVRIVVEYLDGSEGCCTTRHTFAEGHSGDLKEQDVIEVALLYRPGHYDLLYR